MSAIADELNGTPELITVLFTLYNDMDLLDVAGPYDIFANALHAKNQRETKAFRVVCAGPQTAVTSSGLGFAANVSYEQALKNLPSVDVVVVPGSRKDLTLKNNPDVVGLIKAYAALQKKDPSRERTILGVGVAALAFVEADILTDMVATTHPDFITKLEIICSNKKTRDMTSRTDVMEERYIVNNPRFELGNNEEENPYILTRKELKEQKRRKSSSSGLPSPLEEQPNGSGRRPSSARKGSVSFKASNNDRDGVMKRKVLPQSGLRVLTTNGSAAGADAALYLVGALVSDDSAEESARQSGWTWKKGVVVKGVDV